MCRIDDWNDREELDEIQYRLMRMMLCLPGDTNEIYDARVSSMLQSLERIMVRYENSVKEFGDWVNLSLVQFKDEVGAYWFERVGRQNLFPLNNAYVFWQFRAVVQQHRRRIMAEQREREAAAGAHEAYPLYRQASLFDLASPAIAAFGTLDNSADPDDLTRAALGLDEPEYFVLVDHLAANEVPERTEDAVAAERRFFTEELPRRIADRVSTPGRQQVIYEYTRGTPTGKIAGLRKSQSPAVANHVKEAAKEMSGGSADLCDMVRFVLKELNKHAKGIHKCRWCTPKVKVEKLELPKVFADELADWLIDWFPESAWEREYIRRTLMIDWDSADTAHSDSDNLVVEWVMDSCAVSRSEAIDRIVNTSVSLIEICKGKLLPYRKKRSRNR